MDYSSCVWVSVELWWLWRCCFLDCEPVGFFNSGVHIFCQLICLTVVCRRRRGKNEITLINVVKWTLTVFAVMMWNNPSGVVCGLTKPCGVLFRPSDCRFQFQFHSSVVFVFFRLPFNLLPFSCYVIAEQVAAEHMYCSFSFPFCPGWSLTCRIACRSFLWNQNMHPGLCFVWLATHPV